MHLPHVLPHPHTMYQNATIIKGGPMLKPNDKHRHQEDAKKKRKAVKQALYTLVLG